MRLHRSVGERHRHEEYDRILHANAPRIIEKYPRYSEQKARTAIARGQRVGYVLADTIEVPGIRSLAMAVHKPDGEVIGAISISAMTQRLDEERLDELVPAMKAAVSAIQNELATQPTVHFG